MQDSAKQASTPKIAVSACLLGHPVRYNGRHKRDRFITDQLSQVLQFIPVCPEVEAGMESAHRASYRAFVGPIPEFAGIRQACGNRLCVNPDHLEQFTQQNQRRSP